MSMRSQALKLNLLLKHGKFMHTLLLSLSSPKLKARIKLSLFPLFLCLGSKSLLPFSHSSNFHPSLTKGCGKVLNMAVH
jgi:hypothetical protein